MNTHAEKIQENKSAANAMPQKQSSTFQFEDNRPEAIQIRKQQELVHNSPRAKELAQFQKMAYEHAAKQQRTGVIEGNTGKVLPDFKREKVTQKSVQTSIPLQRKGDKPLPSRELDFLKKKLKTDNVEQGLSQINNTVNESNDFIKVINVTAMIEGEPSKEDLRMVVENGYPKGERVEKSNNRIIMNYDLTLTVILYNAKAKKLWMMLNGTARLNWSYKANASPKERKLQVDNVARGTDLQVGEYNGDDGVETLKGFGASKLLEYIILPKVVIDAKKEEGFWKEKRENIGGLEWASSFLRENIPGAEAVLSFVFGTNETSLKDHWSELVGGMVINKETVEITKPFLEWFWKNQEVGENKEKKYQITKEGLAKNGPKGWEDVWGAMILGMQKSPLVILMLALGHSNSEILNILEGTKISNIKYGQLTGYYLTWPRPTEMSKISEN